MAFVQIMKKREERLKRLIAAGVVSNPDIAQDFDQAKAFVGTCTRMAPDLELLKRVHQKSIDRLERVGLTSVRILENIGC